MLDNDIVRNVWVWVALLLCLLLLAGALYVPPLASVLKLVPPDPAGWLVIGAFSLAPVLLGQLYKALVQAIGSSQTRLAREHARPPSRRRPQ